MVQDPKLPDSSHSPRVSSLGGALHIVQEWFPACLGTKNVSWRVKRMIWTPYPERHTSVWGPICYSSLIYPNQYLSESGSLSSSWKSAFEQVPRLDSIACYCARSTTPDHRASFWVTSSSSRATLSFPISQRASWSLVSTLIFLVSSSQLLP